ncbi:FTR1 family protein [Saccharopolyspora rosea]
MWADALPNLLVGLREGLEGGLVVSILLAAVRRSEGGGSTRPVWLGVAAASTLALSFGAVLTFYRSVLPTTGQELLGGVLSVIAVVLVTGMIFWMRRAARSLSGELREKVADALRVSSAAVAMTAFLAIGREGLETALFLWTAAQASGETVAPLVGAAVGIAVAVGLCVALYRSAVRIRLGVFFDRTAVLLIVIAAGVLSYGLGDLQDAGLLPGRTWVAFDLTTRIDPSSWWATIVTGITELSPRMTWLQVVAYVGYLGTVLGVFLRARRAPAPAPAAPEQAETPAEPVPPGPARRRLIAVGVAAVLVVPPVAAIALIAFAPGRQAAAAQRIEVTASGCGAGWTKAQGGAQTYTVVNKSGHPAEINLVRAQGIVAEIETLGPGTEQSIPITLGGGDYTWRCLISGLPTTSSPTVHVDGGPATAGPPPVTPVSAEQLEPPRDAYDAYVEGVLGQLADQVATLRADLAAGRLDAARRDWLPAQLTWERVGAAYGSFDPFGDAIGGKPQGLPAGVDDPGFTGLHRLEHGLWHGQSATQLLPVADRLGADVATLRAQLPSVTIDPVDLPKRAHEILEDALRDHLTGATDQGAGATYPETLADVQVTRQVLDQLAPLLDARRPDLLPTARRQLDDLERALLATRTGDHWQSLTEAPTTARERVDSATGAVLETLADVPTLLEPPAH